MDITQEVYEIQLQLTSLQYSQWLGALFSYQWWLLLLVLIGSWVLWWKLVDKKTVFETLTFALVVMLLGTTLDVYGVKLGLWCYPIKIFYLNPGLITGDWALPPVLKSLAYQRFPDWNRFIIALIIISAGLAFIGEPLLSWTGVYVLYRWHYAYSFVVYILGTIFAKWLVDKIRRSAI